MKASIFYNGLALELEGSPEDVAKLLHLLTPKVTLGEVKIDEKALEKALEKVRAEETARRQGMNPPGVVIKRFPPYVPAGVSVGEEPDPSKTGPTY